MVPLSDYWQRPVIEPATSFQCSADHHMRLYCGPKLKQPVVNYCILDAAMFHERPIGMNRCLSDHGSFAFSATSAIPFKAPRSLARDPGEPLYRLQGFVCIHYLGRLFGPKPDSR